jgi:ParB family transcriptional regulator, chromosome partitioning protein
MSGELISIPLASIRENPVALRAVNRESESYQGIVDSIRQKGFMGAITVRPREDSESGESYYELVDGLHRFNAAKDAGISEINVHIKDLKDDQVLEAQIMANVHKVETRPVEYSKQLIRILQSNPMLTEAELASKISKSASWIKERLGLLKLPENIGGLVDEGKIKLANAYALAKLPEEEQADFVDRAMTMKPDEFIPLAHQRVKEIRDAKRKGEDAPAKEFQPVSFLQKLVDIKKEDETGEVGKALIKELGIKEPQQAWSLAVKWALHLDPKSVEVQKSKDEQRKAAKAEAKKKRDGERAKKKAAKAQEKAKEAAEEAAKAAEALNG